MECECGSKFELSGCRGAVMIKGVICSLFLVLVGLGQIVTFPPVSTEGVSSIKFIPSNECCSYYVDATGGDDANSGQTPTLAWKTIAKVNAATLVAGQSVGFKRGETWRETLTPGQSGAAGSPITFAAYGSGAKPIISGADVVTGAWTNLPASENTADSTTGTANSRLANYIYYAPVTSISAGDVTSINVYLSGTGNTAAALYTQSSGGPASLVADCTTAAITAGTAGWHQFIPGEGCAVDATTVYWVGVQSAASWASGCEDGTGSAIAFEAHGYDGIFPATASETGPYTKNPAHIFITVAAGASNVWSASATTQPYIAFFDGTRGTKTASIATVSSANKWFWASNLVYVYSTSDPATAFTSPGIELGARTYGVNGNSKNYLTVDGLAFIGQNSYGVDNAGTNLSVLNSAFSHLGGAQSFGGFAILLRGVNSQAAGNTVSYINGRGIGAYGADNTVTGNTISDCWNGLEYPNQEGRGIDVAAARAVISNNVLARNSAGIFTTGAQDTVIKYNVLSDHHVNGIDIQNGTDDHPVLVYHNTVKHKPAVQDGHGINGQLLTRSVVFKNNLVYSDFTGTNNNVQCVYFDAADYHDIDIDYNLYYLAAGSTSNIGRLGAPANVYNTLADWKTALAGTAYSGGDVHAVSADPLFTNAAAGDFTLQAGSPAIGTGVYIAGVSTANPPNIGAK